ncbi:MAG TPA: hypothetical protein VHU84_01175 [Lacipirellulaceae bacterium]|nr:hypothetical protein [Lacipirellulaceae bacterium]
MRYAGIAILVSLGAFRSTQAQPFARQTETAEVIEDHSTLPQPPEVIVTDALPSRLPDLQHQTREEADAKSRGCIQCHEHATDMHAKATVKIGCVDCHGGNPTATDKFEAHVHPIIPDAWPSSANPVRSYTLLNHESPEFIRFVNPGDLRVAPFTCGPCHGQEVMQVRKSMMTHGCMLWGAALYNNGAVPFKQPRYGESYSLHGTPQRIQNVPQPTADEIANKGVLPYLDPLARFEISQPSNVLRIFERGGRFRTDVGIPETLEESGRPRQRLSDRGLGTLNRTDPVFISLQKTRLFDPTLNFLGTNDHAGDYRSSGCTACHVVYANDRSPIHSGPFSKFGNRGESDSDDPMIPKNESGHPIKHKFVVAPPTSQCIVCHVHPGTNVLNTYLGYMWWDNETDGEVMYPKVERKPSAQEFVQSLMNNPDESAARGLWSDPKFLENVVNLNPMLRHTQFADFHGHGWVFRAVYKRDRKGNFLDYKGRVIKNVGTEQLMAAMTPPTEEERLVGKQREGTPVHYMDIHLEKGMHCVDCHFQQDVHGNTMLYNEVRAACEIQCTDCHGTVTATASLHTSGPAAPKDGTDLSQKRTPFGKRLFEQQGNKLIQNSMADEGRSWEVVQVKDTITPGSGHYNEKSALAKTIRFGGDSSFEWGDVPSGDDSKCAHCNKNMSCIACHSSWNTACFGCHLPQRANLKMPSLHNEGDVSRNYVSYNFQTLRDDVYMLARDGNVTGNRIGPCRSACAVHVTSYNDKRESIYTQQQTISGDGFSGIAFSTNVPHTVRGGPPHVPELRNPDVHRHLPSETKMCTDCHVSATNNNNAYMATLLMQGSNFVNFMGRFCWVAEGENGFEAVAVTERDEPQAVIGSSLHKLAYPEEYHKHLENNCELEIAHEHPGKDIADSLLHPLEKPEILSVQARGEYLYAACGHDGLRVFDIAFVDDKGFSERVTTAPVSPLGQQFYVKTSYAAAIAAPCTTAPDPTRVQHSENHEDKVHPLYGYIYIADKCEGLILVGAATLLDGNPTNNFLRRELTFNPDHILDGAHAITIAGHYAYICCNAGLVVVSLETPTKPQVTAVIGGDVLKHPIGVQVQFRYAIVGDAEGLKVFDVSELSQPKFVSGLELADIHNFYLARTYAYVAAGRQGLVIVDIENPEVPFVDQVYDAGGQINDLQDVKLGITNASEFAYLADGKNGLRVVQLTSADTPGSPGFSPRPVPCLIATRKPSHGGKALAISEGLDRDRAVDESGHQISVFGRVGARPFNLEEQQKMYLRNSNVWKVTDNPADYEDGYRAPTTDK